jgi:hypothetical protein
VGETTSHLASKAQVEWPVIVLDDKPVKNLEDKSKTVIMQSSSCARPDILINMTGGNVRERLPV